MELGTLSELAVLERIFPLNGTGPWHLERSANTQTNIFRSTGMGLTTLSELAVLERIFPLNGSGTWHLERSANTQTNIFRSTGMELGTLSELATLKRTSFAQRIQTMTS